MSATTNIFRRGAVYYFRRQLRWPDGAIQGICISLRTRRLAEARQRATRLAACCETLRRRLTVLTARNPLTIDQRREIFARELALDFEALEALEDAIHHRSNPDIRPQVYGDCLERDLETMAIVGRSWLTSGWPSPDHYDNCESYIAREFGGRMDELELVLLLGSLENSLEHVRETVWRGADTALSAVGAEVNDRNRFAACKTVYGAKLEAIDSYREGMEHPELSLTRGETTGRDRIPDSCAPYAVDVEWPHRLLTQVDHSGWPIEHRIAPPRAAPESPLPAVANPVPADWANVTIVEAAERYILAEPKTGASEAGSDDKRVSWIGGTLRQFRAAAMLAGKACPGPIVQLCHDDLNRLSNLFGRLPANHHKSPRHEEMTLAEIIEEATELRGRGELKGGIGLGISTINRHVRFLKDLFDWVGRRVPMPEIRWSEFTFTDRRDRRGLRKKIGTEQAQALFQLPPWTGCLSDAKRFKPGAKIFHDSAYWVLLIIWYTGMRLTECCKLMLDEIGQESGIWYIVIDENENGGVKTEASKRKLPMHSELIRLGLPDFVTMLRQRGERSLFPELLEGATAPAKTWYTRCGQYLKRHLSFLKPLMGGHSMRHSVETALKKVKVQEEVRNDLLGRVNPGEGAGRYADAADLIDLVSVVEQIPVATARLLPQPIRLLPRLSHRTVVQRAPRRQNQPRRTGTKSTPARDSPIAGSAGRTGAKRKKG